jgi:hypothetical protein
VTVSAETLSIVAMHWRCTRDGEEDVELRGASARRFESKGMDFAHENVGETSSSKMRSPVT